jgi:hypothetical protein
VGKRPFGEILNVGCEVGSEITEVGEKVRGEEGVLCGRQDDVLGEKTRKGVNQGRFTITRGADSLSVQASSHLPASLGC